MHWNSFSDFLAMGGYATYVWGSFAATVLLMVLEPILLIRGRKSLITRLKRQFRAESAERTEQSPRRSKN